MALGPQFRRPTLLAATLALVAAVGASPARADRCEDTAKELKSQIDGLKISVNTGNMIYLTHPAAKEMSLGCRGRNYSVELLRQDGPQAEAAILRPGRLGRRHHFHDSEAATLHRHLALHQAHGSPPGRQGFHALPAGSTWNAAHQDRGLDRR
jgi:hypothetical protein